LAVRLAIGTVALAAALLPALGGASSEASATRLTIRVWPQGRAAGAPVTWTLRCGPTEGSHPDAGRACRRLGALRRPFAGVPRRAGCVQIYGGPEEALVQGRFRGRRIRTRFNLRNGCQIARWKRLRPLLPAVGA
jgi:hypothetical protein